jgi:hypothetical protein
MIPLFGLREVDAIWAFLWVHLLKPIVGSICLVGALVLAMPFIFGGLFLMAAVMILLFFYGCCVVAYRMVANGIYRRKFHLPERMVKPVRSH